MTKTEAFIPVTQGRSFAGKPIGYVKYDEGKIVFKINSKEKITENQINTMELAFQPTYQITKVKDGIVEEVELVSIGIVKQTK